MPPTPKALSASSFPSLGPDPGASGHPEGHRSGARGSGRLQARSSWAWHGVARPHLRLGFPPVSLWAELAGPHRLLGSLCLINGAGAVCGAYRRNAWRRRPRAAAAPPPRPSLLANAPPASGNQSQPRAGLGSGELCLAGPFPLLWPAFPSTPQITVGVSPFPPVNLYLS